MDNQAIDDNNISMEAEWIINNVYRERDACVRMIAQLAIQLGYRAGIGLDEHEEPGWQAVIFVDLPQGQVSWHVPDSEIKWFSFLPTYTGTYDGHTTEQKYQRITGEKTW